MHTDSNTELQNLIPVITSNVSSNRIKIQEILLILQLETGYFSKLFISEMHSKQWHYSLHRDSRTAILHEEVLQDSSSSNSSSNPTRAHYTTIQRILHPESNSTYRRQRALRVLPLHSRGQRNLHSRNSTHRRQGDLLEMHPCVLPDIPVIPVIPVAPETFRTFQSFMTFQPFQAILQCSSISRESTPFQHFPIRMHILQFYSSIGFQRKLHRVPVGQLQTLRTFILQRKGDVAISVKLTDYSK